MLAILVPSYTLLAEETDERHGMADLNELIANCTQEGRYLLFDGGMGSMLGAQGYDISRVEQVLLDYPEAVQNIHRLYVEAGSQIITTNTFGANQLKFDRLNLPVTVEEYIARAITCARDAGAPFVALDMGPLGEMLEPYGDLTEEEAYELFAQQVKAGVTAGADLFIIETMASDEEACLAIKAAKDLSSLPIFATMTFNANGSTFFGVSVEDGIKALCEAGADLVGINCSVGPVELLPVVKRALTVATKPLIVQANAGLPQMVDGKAQYVLQAQDYAQATKEIYALGGIGALGGCCGTTNDFIAAIKTLL